MEEDTENLQEEISLNEIVDLAEVIIWSTNFYIRLENGDEYNVKSYQLRRFGDGNFEVILSHLTDFNEYE